MSITLPKGRKIQAQPDEIFIQGRTGVLAFPRKIQALETEATIIPGNYVLLRQGETANSAVAIEQSFNGKNYIESHKESARTGRTVVTPAKFMPHIKDVNNALQGEDALYDAFGFVMEGDKLRNYGNRINNDSWVWLNAGFPKGEGFRNLSLATVTGLDEQGEPIMSVVPLEDCLDKDGWADLESVNSQGFPTKKAPVNSYEPGKTIYFYSPRQDAVARFGADSVRADLDCYGYPSYRGSSLGVFPCAEGACTQKNQEK